MGNHGKEGFIEYSIYWLLILLNRLGIYNTKLFIFYSFLIKFFFFFDGNVPADLSRNLVVVVKLKN